eukprot:1588464-Rhodomonas_salina.4
MLRNSNMVSTTHFRCLVTEEELMLFRVPAPMPAAAYGGENQLRRQQGIAPLDGARCIASCA